MKLTDEAESLMLYQFRNSTKLNALIRSLIFPLEELEQQLKNLSDVPHIENAQGESLDILGRLVGQPRLDLNDEDYRAWILVGIKLNRGSGTLEDLLGILALLYQKEPEVLIHEHQPNFVAFTFLTMPKTPIKVLLAIIRSACSVSRRSIFVRGNSQNTALFDESNFSQSNFCELIKENIL